MVENLEEQLVVEQVVPAAVRGVTPMKSAWSGWRQRTLSRGRSNQKKGDRGLIEGRLGLWR